MKRKLSVLVLALVVGFMLNTAAMATDAAQYKAALTAAENTLRDAESKVQLWTTSDILLSDAAKAAASGDYKQAVKLANEARIHGELAVATAEREKKIWLKSVPE